MDTDPRGEPEGSRPSNVQVIHGTEMPNAYREDGVQTLVVPFVPAISLVTQ